MSTKGEEYTSEFQAAVFARWEASQLDPEVMRREFQKRVARSLMAQGVTLIPSEHLEDHQYVVSVGVYKAAKRLIEEAEKSKGKK
jgi:hypothetical protein